MSLSTSSPTSPVDRMNAYKGDKKDFTVYIRVAGIGIGSAVPWLLAAIAAPKDMASFDRTESVLAVLQSFSLVSVLFLNEFIQGVKARTISKQAAFSPAAAQMNNTAPFEVVECNRIHLNHMESAGIYVPAVLSAAAAGADTGLLLATSVTWVVARVLYRWGYTNRENPYWRLFGTAASVSQGLTCLGLFGYQMVRRS